MNSGRSFSCHGTHFWQTLHRVPRHDVTENRCVAIEQQSHGHGLATVAPAGGSHRRRPGFVLVPLASPRGKSADDDGTRTATAGPDRTTCRQGFLYRPFGRNRRLPVPVCPVINKNQIKSNSNLNWTVQTVWLAGRFGTQVTGRFEW